MTAALVAMHCLKNTAAVVVAQCPYELDFNSLSTDDPFLKIKSEKGVMAIVSSFFKIFHVLVAITITLRDLSHWTTTLSEMCCMVTNVTIQT